jgi:hypothetical protein
MANLYTPPQWRNTQQMEGSLRYSINTSTVTYRVAGVWHNSVDAGVDQLAGADLIYTSPTVVPDDVAAQLVAYGVGTVTSV